MMISIKLINQIELEDKELKKRLYLKLLQHLSFKVLFFCEEQDHLHMKLQGHVTGQLEYQR